MELYYYYYYLVNIYSPTKFERRKSPFGNTFIELLPKILT